MTKENKSKRRALKYLVIAFFLFLAGGGIVALRFFRTGLFQPEGTEAIIDQVLNEDLPEIVTGETGFADSDGVRIWYERLSRTDNPRGTILLIRGYTRSALSWRPDLYEPLLAAGYQVIRFDNRDVGMSDWITDWSEETAYTLDDMAQDAFAVLDAVGVEKAHVVGISMGGSIAQEMAIQRPDRVLTLTLIATSAGQHNPERPKPSADFSQRVKWIVLRYGFFSDIRNQLRMQIAIEEAVRGDGNYAVDVKETAQTALYEIRRRQGYNPAAGDHQMTAMDNSPSRFAELQNLNIPTLVVHGAEDILSSREDSEKLAAAIPNAATLWLEGMGHDVVPPYTNEILSGIFDLINAAGENILN